MSTEGANPNIDADFEGGTDSAGHTGPGDAAGPGGEAGARDDGGTTASSDGGCSMTAQSGDGALEGFALCATVLSLAGARRRWACRKG